MFPVTNVSQSRMFPSHDRVRNGKRWTPAAKGTNIKLKYSKEEVERTSTPKASSDSHESDIRSDGDDLSQKQNSSKKGFTGSKKVPALKKQKKSAFGCAIF